jgi:hypothetical protein
VDQFISATKLPNVIEDLGPVGQGKSFANAAEISYDYSN